MAKVFPRVDPLLVVCLGCVLVSSAAVAAPPQPGPGPGPGVAAPDLAIREIKLQQISAGDIPITTMGVGVKNIGKKSSGPFDLILCWTHDAGGSPAFPLIRTAHVAALAPDTALYVPLTFVSLAKSGASLRGMFIAAVDIPVSGAPAGRVAESKENNNVFGVTVDMDKVKVPTSWINPAVK